MSNPVTFSDTENPAALTIRGVLQISSFRKLWLARAVSEFGDSLTNLGLLILINRLTGSTAALATMTIVLLLPNIVFGLVAGVYVDRLNRQHIMIVSDLVRGIFVLGFMVVGSADQIWILYLIGLLQASIGTFFSPAQNALIPNVVPEHGLIAANSLTQISMIISITLGGAAAGVLAGTTGLIWPLFALDSLSFFVSVFLVTRIKLTSRDFSPKTESRKASNFFQELSTGLKVNYQNRILRGTLIAAGVALLGIGAVSVLSVPFLVNVLKSSETWLGPISLAGTAATILSGFVIGSLTKRFKPPFLISAGLVIFGAAVALTGFVNAPWQLILFQFTIGWVLTPINVSIVTLNQTAVDDSLRGRVGSARAVIGSSAELLSMGFAGVFGDLIGIRQVFFIAAALIILAGFASAFTFRVPASQKDSVSLSEGLK